MKEYQGKENLDIMKLAVNYNNSIFEWIKNDMKQNIEILDFGAGKGEFCNRFSKNIVAVELDDSMHQYLKCESKKSIENFDRTFDLVYSSNVLEHIEDDDFVLRELYNKLNNGGIIKILVPARMELYTKMDENVGHVRRYEKKELIEKVSNAGFTITKCGYFDFLGYFATLAYKYIDNSGTVNNGSLKFYDNYIFPISRFIDKVFLGKLIGKNLIIEGKKQL